MNIRSQLNLVRQRPFKRNAVFFTERVERKRHIKSAITAKRRRLGRSHRFAKEIDFVATKQNTKEYYQVSLTALDERVKERELDPLKKVSDNYPKYLLTLDFITGDYEGIEQVNIIDWLLTE